MSAFVVVAAAVAILMSTSVASACLSAVSEGRAGPIATHLQKGQRLLDGGEYTRARLTVQYVLDWTSDEDAVEQAQSIVAMSHVRDERASSTDLDAAHSNDARDSCEANADGCEEQS